jgi:hypothetical protein
LRGSFSNWRLQSFVQTISFLPEDFLANTFAATKKRYIFISPKDNKNWAEISLLVKKKLECKSKAT